MCENVVAKGFGFCGKSCFYSIIHSVESAKVVASVQLVGSNGRALFTLKAGVNSDLPSMTPVVA